MYLIRLQKDRITQIFGECDLKMKDKEINELLKLFGEMEGVDVRVDVINSNDDLDSSVITSKDIRVELERIMILIEEQQEYEIAVEKLKELDSLFDDIEWGMYDFEIKWGT